MDPETDKAIAESAKTAADYWTVLHRIYPLMVVGGIVGLITNFMRIAHERSWRGKIFTFITVISVGFIAAGTTALGLELFIVSPTLEIELLCASVAGSTGQKMFDLYARRIFGLQNTRATDRQPAPVLFTDVLEKKDEDEKGNREL